MSFESYCYNRVLIFQHQDSLKLMFTMIWTFIENCLYV